ESRTPAAGRVSGGTIPGYNKTTICTPKNSSEEKPWEDDVLRQLNAKRDKYGAEFGFDLDKIFADLKRREVSSHCRAQIRSALTEPHSEIYEFFCRSLKRNSSCPLRRAFTTFTTTPQPSRVASHPSV